MPDPIAPLLLLNCKIALTNWAKRKQRGAKVPDPIAPLIHYIVLFIFYPLIINPLTVINLSLDTNAL